MLASLALLAVSALGAAEGTVIDIRTAQDLIKFSTDVNNKRNSNATVYLQSDLDFSGLSGEFRIIGESSDRSFAGVFDGQGHTISHLTLTNTDKYHFGLFGASYGATVRNVIMDSTCTVIGTSVTNTTCTWDPYTLNVGGLMGYCLSNRRACLLESSVFMGKVAFTGSTPQITNVHLGGIVGEAYASSYLATVKNCANYGSITFAGRADTTTIGGVAGRISSKYERYGARLLSCLNAGALAHTGTTRVYLNVGGVLGGNSNSYDVIDAIVNVGAITLNSAKAGDTRQDSVGALVGVLSNTFVTHSFWAGDAYAKGAGSTAGSAELCESTYFDDVTFKLGKSVFAGPYLGSSLIGALNAVAAYREERAYSRWLVNGGGNVVAFAVNGGAPFVKINAKVVLMPSLADGMSKKFDGWYTDSACTAEITSFEISESTTLYGKFA